MKFKYYLRGAGIGIIVSTIILSAASLFQDNMSDAEIIQRAMELGMVMEEGTGGTLADMPSQGNIDPNASTMQDDEQNKDGNGQPDASNDGSDTGNQDNSGNSGNIDDQATQPNPSQEDDKSKDDQSGQSDQDNDGQEKDNTKQDKNDKKEKEKVTVKIEGGDVSRAVSQKVFEAGLVDDAEEFNNYLGDHGYDNLLQPGTYHINNGASFQQIAEILTNK